MIQLSTLEYSVVIDCLPLWDKVKQNIKALFENEKILKILHGCNSDLRCLLASFESRCFPIFDTAQGHGALEEAIFFKTKKEAEKGLKFISKFYLNLEIDKSYQRAKYTLRPMTDNMYLYALNDARLCIHIFYLMMGLTEFLLSNREDEFMEKLYLAFFKDREAVPLSKGKTKYKAPKAYKRIYKNILDRSYALIEKNEKNRDTALQVKPEN